MWGVVVNMNQQDVFPIDEGVSQMVLGTPGRHGALSKKLCTIWRALMSFPILISCMDFLNDAMVPTGALQLFVIWEVINSIEEFHEHLVHGRILSLILLGDTMIREVFLGCFFLKSEISHETRAQTERKYVALWLWGKFRFHFNGFKQQWVSDLQLESWCCKPFGGIIDWTAAFVLIKHVGQQNPGENGSMIVCPVLSRANGFRLPAMSFSGHCLNFRSKCNSTSLLTSANHSHEKPRKLQPSLQKKYILTSSSCWRPFSYYDILTGTDLQRVSGRDPGSRGVPRFFGSTSPYPPGPPHPWKPSASSFALSGWRAPNKRWISSTHWTMRKNVHGIFAFTIRKSEFKSIEFSTGHLKTRCCFHHHTPPRTDIPPTNAAIPGICRSIRNQEAKSPIKRPCSLILAEFNHQVKDPFSGGAAPSCYCWPRSLYQSPTILAAILAWFPHPKPIGLPEIRHVIVIILGLAIHGGSHSFKAASHWAPGTTTTPPSAETRWIRLGAKLVDGWRNCQESLLNVYFTPDCFFGWCLKDQVMYEWLSGVGGIEAPTISVFRIMWWQTIDDVGWTKKNTWDTQLSLKQPSNAGNGGKAYAKNFRKTRKNIDKGNSPLRAMFDDHYQRICQHLRTSWKRPNWKL